MALSWTSCEIARPKDEPSSVHLVAFDEEGDGSNLNIEVGYWEPALGGWTFDHGDVIPNPVFWRNIPALPAE